MTEKEKNETNSTEKKTERVFVLGIGKGPKMRTIRLVIAPKEKDINVEGLEPPESEKEKEDPKQDI